MPVTSGNIMFLGSANMQTTDSGTQGGALTTSVKMTWADLVANSQVEAVAEAADGGETCTIYGRTSDGSLVNETTIALNGTTPVQAASPNTFERLLRGTLSAAISGNSTAVAVMATTNVNSGTATAATTTTLTLASGANAAGVAVGMVLRITGGTLGTFQLREILEWGGASEVATVRTWTTPTGTITYEVAPGFVFDSQDTAPANVLDVRRPFYNVASDVTGGSARNFYEKVFVFNNHASLALTTSQIKQFSDGVAAGGGGDITFDLSSALGGTDTSTNRITAPGGYTFDDTDKNVANSQNLTIASGQAVWLHLNLPAGEAALNTTFQLQATGQST